MKTTYTVYYKKENNPNITHYQNETRGTRARVFNTLEAARTFAATVEVVAAYDHTGKKINL